MPLQVKKKQNLGRGIAPFQIQTPVGKTESVLALTSKRQNHFVVLELHKNFREW